MDDTEHKAMKGVFHTGTLLSILGRMMGVALLSCLLIAPVRAADERPNVLWIVVDTLRADHVSLDGIVSFPRDTAPNIRELAQTSTVFSHAVSAAPWTLPSYTSMLTGMHAFHHNHNSTNTTNDPVNRTMLPIYFKNAGYRLVSLQTNSFVRPMVTNLFDETFNYIEPAEETQSTEQQINVDRAAVSMAKKWLDFHEKDSSPFFMFLGLFGPHWPYHYDNDDFEEFVGDTLFYLQDPSTYKPESDGWILSGTVSEHVQSVVDLPKFSYYTDSRLYFAAYNAEIRGTDRMIGLLIDKLKSRGLYDNTVIIVTADHGEHMADRFPYFSHGYSLYIGALHVPMIIKFANQKSQIHISDWVRTIDILPTLMDALDIKGDDEEELDGHSLMPAVRGTAINFSQRPVLSYLGNQGSDVQTLSVVSQDGYHFVLKNEDSKLYDLNNDPFENADLRDQYPETASHLNALLSTFMKSLPH